MSISKPSYNVTKLQLTNKHTTSRQWPAQATLLWTSMRNKVLNVQAEKWGRGKKKDEIFLCMPALRDDG